MHSNNASLTQIVRRRADFDEDSAAKLLTDLSTQMFICFAAISSQEFVGTRLINSLATKALVE